MDCAACVYYVVERECKLHGRLSTLDQWLSCDEFIDASQRYVGGACCGIYNFPLLPKTVDKPDKER